MKKSNLALAIIFIFMLSLTVYSASATDEIDQSQTSGTTDRWPCSGQVYSQSFVPQHETLSKVDLKLRWNGWKPSPGETYERVNVEIRSGSASGSTVGSFKLYAKDMTSSYAWYSGVFSSPLHLSAGTTYWLVVWNYMVCTSSGADGVRWASTTTSAYSGGAAYVNSASQSYDMNFRTYNCVGDVCPSTTPDVRLSSITTKNNGTVASTNFHAGDIVSFSMNAHNYGGAGSSTATYKIYDGFNNLIRSNPQTATVVAGADKVFAWDLWLNSSWSGTYKYEATVTPCTSNCLKTMYFNVSGYACTDQWVCASSAMRAHQLGDCSLIGHTACGTDQVCSAGVCVSGTPAFKMTNAYTKLSSTTTDKFLRGSTATIYQDGQNIGTAAGTGNFQFEVYFNGTKIAEASGSAPVAASDTYTAFATHPIPSDAAYGVYQYKTKVSPCASGNTCEMLKMFSVNAGSTCTAAYKCVNSTHKVLQSSTCSLGTPVACASGQVCSGGVCATPTTPVSLNVLSEYTSNTTSTLNKTAFLQGNTLRIRSSVKNTGTASGTGTFTFSIWKDGIQVWSNVSTSAVNGGLTYSATKDYVIPSAAATGNYVARIEVSPCSGSNTCYKESAFTVSVAAPAFKMTNAYTMYSYWADDSFIRGNTAILYQTGQNIGTAAGLGNYTFDVLFNGNKIAGAVANSTVAIGGTYSASGSYPIPSNATYGVYQYNAKVAPCASGNTCEISKLFSVNAGSTCASKYWCVNTTHRVLQSTTCALGTPTACTGSTICSNGSCVVPSCPANTGNCDGNWGNGCEINLLNDWFNCGACGNACGFNSGCLMGSCVCGTGYMDCDMDSTHSCETDIDTDSDNCGGCGNVCGVGTHCADSACVADVIPDGDYMVLSRYVFEDTADELIDQGRVNEFLFTDMNESAAEAFLSELVEQIKECPRTPSEITEAYSHMSELGLTYSQAEEIFDGADTCMTILDFSRPLAEFISYQLMEGPTYVTAEIPMDGMVPDTSKTALMFFQEEESWTSKAASKVHSALLKYSVVFDKAGGAVSLGSIVFSLWSGAEQYDGSWAHAVIYAGDKQLDSIELLCTALDATVEYSSFFSTDKMFVSSVNPDYEKFSFSEAFHALRESLAKSGHSGADGLDTCYRNGELLECTYHNAQLFEILTYAFPFIESFNDTTSTPGALSYHAGIWDTNMLPIGDFYHNVYVVLNVNTNERPIEQMSTPSPITLVKEYNYLYPYGLDFSVPLNTGEYPINATLTTYTGCSGAIETCGWIGDSKVIVY